MEIFDIKLETYPDWVRILVFGSVMMGTLIYATLVFFAPAAKPDPMEWAELRQVVRGIPSDSLVIVVTLINNTDKTVGINKASLQYFETTPVKSGLQSKNQIDTTYVVSRDEKGLFIDSGDNLPAPIVVIHNTPFAGQPFIEADLPLSEVVEKGKKSKILLMLRDKSLLDKRVRKIRIKIHFSNGSSIERDTNITLS